MLTRTIQHTTHIHIHTYIHTRTWGTYQAADAGFQPTLELCIQTIHTHYTYTYIHTYIHTCIHTYEHRARTRSLAWDVTLLPQPNKSRAAPWALNRCSEAALATSRTAALGLCILGSCSSAERVRRSAPNFLAGFAGLPCVASSSAEAWEHELLMRGSA